MLMTLKQKKLILTFLFTVTVKKLTDSRKRAKILADNRKSDHPIKTLLGFQQEMIRTDEKFLGDKNMPISTV